MTPQVGKHNRWAYLLILGGLALLALQLGWASWFSDWLWALLFFAGGAAFVYLYTRDPRDWWGLIPGAALAAIGAAIVSGPVGGAYFLGVLGLGFAAVYLTGRERWWAIVPAGVLLTLALVAWFDARFPRVDTAWLFFLGVAATFGLLYLLPEGQGRQRWALYPALAALVVLAVVLLTGAVSGVVVPVALILVGAYLLWRGGAAPKGPTLPQGGA
ncbi:MAG TPA: hypothetical protein VFF08_05425 [Trueperaceae bacterium]|nr:hypothetical protein [Trueperaceae bacterium]